ncbi:acyltransferase family protein [Streptomyces flavofungini]|uniref:acyltransferase family protein n=1 Tax=Streptomyces flavofungini TaxID=68200 RepID=UPI0034DF466D
MAHQHDSGGGRRARPNLPSLTGVRFIAAALVFFYHASIPETLGVFEDPDVAEGYAQAFSRVGFAGVSFFFILSGFVLAWSARAQDTLTGFYRRRLLKIFPNHIVTWAAALVFFATVAAVRPGVWLSNLLLVHSWIPRLDTAVSLNQPNWSLCSELLFYLLFPLLWRWVRTIRSNRLWAWFGITFTGLLSAQIMIDMWAPASQDLADWPLTLMEAWLGYNFPPLRLFEFVLGMLVARLLAEGHRVSPGLVPALALTGAGYALVLALPWQYGFNVVLAVPLSLLVAALADADLSGRRTGLRGRFLTLLGEVSFAFYLVHFMVLVVVQDVLRGRQYGTGTALAVIALVFVVAQLLGWVLYAGVERPVMRRWAGTPRKTVNVPGPHRPQLVDQQG